MTWYSCSPSGTWRRRSDSSAGTMTTQVINAVAEFERDLLIKRTNAGIRRAKSEGKVFGHPSTLSKEAQIEVVAAFKLGRSVAQLAKDYKTSRQTIMRIRALNVSANL